MWFRRWLKKHPQKPGKAKKAKKPTARANPGGPQRPAPAPRGQAPQPRKAAKPKPAISPA